MFPNDVHPGGESAFFEIAATLIPLLLFGGILVERIKPPPQKRWRERHEYLVLLLIVFGGLTLIAEAAAIRAVVIGKSQETVTRALVAIVLVVGMSLVIAAISTPWLARIRKADPDFYKVMLPSSLVVVGSCAVLAAAMLIDGTNVANEYESLTAYRKASARNSEKLAEVNKRAESLSREEDRVRSRLEIARARNDRPAVEALSKQIKTLRRLFSANLVDTERLLRESRELSERWLAVK